jgi:hypothetical protein
MVFLPGGLKKKLRAVLAAHIDEMATRMEIGSHDAGEAAMRLRLCRLITPKVKWELVTWKIRKEVFFAPHRLDGKSSLGDVVKRSVVEEGGAA